MLEIQIRRPIKFCNSCLCTSNSGTGVNPNKRGSSFVRNGLVTKNGLDYFPEEFLPEFAANKDRSSLKIDLQKENKDKDKTGVQLHTGFQSDVYHEDIGVGPANSINILPSAVNNLNNTQSMRNNNPSIFSVDSINGLNHHNNLNAQ